MKFSQAKEILETYQTKFRHPDLPAFEISKFYDLFPDQDSLIDHHKWPEEYPHNGRYGVYFILDSSENILYIGKANSIGRRLGSYFGGRGKCIIKHEGWSAQPRYIVTVAVDNEYWFEFHSLEEYLIWKIDPSNNIRSRSYSTIETDKVL